MDWHRRFLSDRLRCIMLTGIHFLLTYTCTYECDHCFVYSGPFVGGTFTLKQIKEVLDEADRLGTVKMVYFEGGEPFLFYPLMVAGIKLARAAGFQVGVVSNAYWATSVPDAKLWLEPLKELGVIDISISDDSFHGDDEATATAKHGINAARKLQLPVDSICIEEPQVKTSVKEPAKGEPIVGGGVTFKGRAVEKLTEGLPTRNWEQFTECVREELRDPGRVHVDAYGNVQVCQGISIGNMWETSLSQLMASYDADSHPICGPLLKGGPAELARQYDIKHDTEYVDECHFCFALRKALIDRFPQYLAPRQVYGLE